MINKISNKICNTIQETFRKSFPKKLPEINQNILFYILSEILVDRSEFTFKMGSYKFLKHEFSGRGLGLIFTNSSEKHVLYISTKVSHVFLGKYSVTVRWLSEDIEKELPEEFQKLLNELWQKEYGINHPDFGE